jgi:hypothetical protein
MYIEAFGFSTIQPMSCSPSPSHPAFFLRAYFLNAIRGPSRATMEATCTGEAAIVGSLMRASALTSSRFHHEADAPARHVVVSTW